MTRTLKISVCMLAAGIVLGACAHQPDAAPRVATPQQQQALADLERDYNAGEYARVARTVGLSSELQTAPPDIHVPALKLQAFSYCLQGNTPQCARRFERLLERYPEFDLAASERDHPMWGPVFAQVKAGASAR